jgi:hypothetical protein
MDPAACQRLPDIDLVLREQIGIGHDSIIWIVVVHSATGYNHQTEARLRTT